MKLIKLSKPLFTLCLFLTYSLGSGIAHYLGHTINISVLALGFLAIWAIQVASIWLVEYFRLPAIPSSPGETRHQRERFRVTLLQAAFAALTLFSGSVITLLITRSVDLTTGFLLITMALLWFVYSIPPVCLIEKGYGELILATVWGIFSPAIAYLLQYSQFHRLLPILGFPLAVLSLAYLLATDFSTYAADMRSGRQSFLIRLSWQRAIPIHHGLLLSGFLLLAAAPFFGISWNLIAPSFFALPFAVMEILWLQRIGAGGPPFWKFFNALTPSVFALIAYLLSLAFWLR